MDPHRNFPDEFSSDSDGRWFPAERGYPEAERERRADGEPRYRRGGDPDPDYEDRGYGDPERIRVPEPRGAGAGHGGFDFDDERRGGTRFGEPAEPDLDSSAGRSHPLVADGPESLGRDAGLPSGRRATIGPRSGEPLPPRSGEPRPPMIDEPLSPFRHDAPIPHETGELPLFDAPARHLTETIDRAALRRPPPGPDPVGPGVYRSPASTRRPGLAAVIIIATVVLELPALRLLLAGFAQIAPSATVAGAFMAIGLPMAAVGLYSVLTGAAAVAAAPYHRAWVRSPLVYLPVGLLLLLSAALAAAGTSAMVAR